MKRLPQHLLSLLLPVAALVIVPVWVEPHWRRAGTAGFTSGMLLMLLGLLIMAHTIGAFIRIGRGTLAPWSPTTRLVSVGLYAHVRNPMILGVLVVLLGEALAFGSCRILAWALTFFAVNTFYFIVSEEPALERRFGEEYVAYRKNVPRWIPRLRPWRGKGSSAGSS